MSLPRPKLESHRNVGFYFSCLGACALAASTSSGCSDSESGPGSGGAGGSSGKASAGGASGSVGAGGKSGSGGAGGAAGSSGAGGTAGGGGSSGTGSGGSSGAAGSGGSSGAAGSGGVDLDELGKPCFDGKCPQGITPVEYCGIAGCDVGSFCSCEIPCTKGPAVCPPGTTCATIADGPGEVCVKS